MTVDPACCSPDTTLDQVAKLMLQNDCGEIPVVDKENRPVGVVTDRDIVCRSVAEGQNPTAQTADSIMTRTVITVRPETSLDEVIATMERHQIRRVPVVDDGGFCAGIISQADLVAARPDRTSAEFVREVSRATGHASQ
jgi:CBS domain-containing protein